MITQTETTDVAVVGAGPTGLTAAARLAQLGVAHVVVDADAGPVRESRAALVHAATLEILDELGVADELIAAGVRINRIGFCDRGRVIASIGLAGVPSRYRFALGVPQSTTEQVLLERLAALGGGIRRGHRAAKVTPAAEGYLVTGTRPAEAGAAGFAIGARYVIGCDGAHSIVRSAAGLGFPGSTYPPQFVLADAELAAPPGPDDEARIFTSPHGVVVTGRLPSGNHRIVATVDTGAAVPDPPGRAFIDAILRERGVGQLAADPVWSSRFRVAHRVANRFRAGGVFLCGDAAHVHSPAAGQGMNTGIADAYDLATRLAAVLTGQAGVAVLDGYETDRRPAALEVVTFTDRMTTMATVRSPIGRALRDMALAAASRIPAIRNSITLWVTGLKRSPLRHDLPPVTLDRPGTLAS
jgi:2-polyprenyl-6-methoxyphenol hydroxylase-like FAD-dependent oxidoreductase